MNRLMVVLAMGIGMHAMAAEIPEITIEDPKQDSAKVFEVPAPSGGDDWPAAKAVLDKAVAAGPGTKVVFAEGTYDFSTHRFIDGVWHLNLSGVSDLVIDGGGATLKMHPSNAFLSLYRCERVVVKNFTLNYTMPHHMQGDIVEVGEDYAYLVVKPHAGYAYSADFPAGEKLPKLDPVIFILHPTANELKRLQVVGNCHIRTTARDIEDNLIRYTIDPRYARGIKSIEVGDRVAAHAYYNGHRANMWVRRSSDCVLEGVTAHSGADMNIRPTLNEGPIAIRRAVNKPRPGSANIVATIRDGIHCRSNRGPLLIEECWFEGMMDDSINIFSLGYACGKLADDGGLYVQRSGDGEPSDYFRPGDKVSLLDRTSGNYLATLTVKKAVPQFKAIGQSLAPSGSVIGSFAASSGPTGRHWKKAAPCMDETSPMTRRRRKCLMTAAKPPNDETTSEARTFQASQDPDRRNRFCTLYFEEELPAGIVYGAPDGRGATEVYNLNACGAGSVVRKNTFMSQRRHALLLSAPNTAFVDNIVDSIQGSAVSGGTQGHYVCGPIPAGTIVMNNKIRNTGFEAIKFATYGTVDGKGDLSRSPAKGFVISGNSIEYKYADAIRLLNVNGAVIKNNTITAAPDAYPGRKALDLVRCTHIERGEMTKLFRVADYGAVGDGRTDDRPAIQRAFDAAKAAGGPLAVVFKKKQYLLGDNPRAWHTFVLEDLRGLTVEGNGATLICADANLAFHFNGGTNITVRGLTLDVTAPRVTQGEVVAIDQSGTVDVKLMDGYPEPPVEAFLKANNHRAWGGGGRHMIVFENGGAARNTRMKGDHLYIRNITRVSPGVFRFFVHEDYMRIFPDVAVGNWVSYGLNKANIPALVKTTKDKSASIYAQIAADRVENITFEDINIHGSLNGGIRVSDMPGDVTLRRVNIVRKPGTRNLLSTCSDALHLMNIRGRMIIEGCKIEAAGDDCINLGAQRENVVAVDGTDKRIVTLRSTDNRYFYYTIEKGDRLQFIDKAANTVLGVRTVVAVTFDPASLRHVVTLDEDVQGVVAGKTQVMHLGQNTRSTVIRNSTIIPYMRNGLLTRAQNMTIENNRIDCSHGGVLGLNLSFASGQDDARLRHVRVQGNTFVCPDNASLVAWRPLRDEGGAPDARDIAIVDNVFDTAKENGVRVDGVDGLVWKGNRLKSSGEELSASSTYVSIAGCTTTTSAH